MINFVPHWIWLGYYMIGLVCAIDDASDSKTEAIAYTMNNFGFKDQQEYALSYPGAIYPIPIGETIHYCTNGIRCRRETKYPHQCCTRAVLWLGENNQQKSEERKELFRVYLNEFEDSENNNMFIFPTMVDVKEGFRYYKRTPPKNTFWFCTDWKG